MFYFQVWVYTTDGELILTSWWMSGDILKQSKKAVGLDVKVFLPKIALVVQGVNCSMWGILGCEAKLVAVTSPWIYTDTWGMGIKEWHD